MTMPSVCYLSAVIGDAASYGLAFGGQRWRPQTLFEMFDDDDVTSLRVAPEAVEEQAAISGQGRQPRLLLPFVVKVDGQGPSGHGQLRGEV